MEAYAKKNVDVFMLAFFCIKINSLNYKLKLNKNIVGNNFKKNIEIIILDTIIIQIPLT